MDAYHVAPGAIRKNSDSGNKRMSGWIEWFQNHDFEVMYRKGEEAVSADALSGLYENEAKKYGLNDERYKMLRETHEKLPHRGLKSVQYELEKKVKWNNMKEMTEQAIKTCGVCSKNNSKHSGGCQLAQVSKPIEKTAIVIMKVGEEDIYILVFIVYLRRLIKIEVLTSRTTKEITEGLKNIFKVHGMPEKLISYNGKELIAKKFEIFCDEKNIRHHLKSIENS